MRTVYGPHVMMAPCPVCGYSMKVEKVASCASTAETVAAPAAAARRPGGPRAMYLLCPGSLAELNALGSKLHDLLPEPGQQQR
jgi:hypothetical protein